MLGTKDYRVEELSDGTWEVTAKKALILHPLWAPWKWHREDLVFRSVDSQAVTWCQYPSGWGVQDSALELFLGEVVNSSLRQHRWKK